MQDNYHIRPAETEDLPEIMAIYAHARQFMTEHGNPRQWAMTNWPPEDLIRQDISGRTCFVCTEDDTIRGVFSYTCGRNIEPTYLEIDDGGWIGGDTYGVVHRLASDGKAHHVGAACIEWAYAQCGHLRVDTHPDNTVMQKLLTGLGFTRCGIIHIEHDPDPRIAYEKL